MRELKESIAGNANDHDDDDQHAKVDPRPRKPRLRSRAKSFESTRRANRDDVVVKVDSSGNYLSAVRRRRDAGRQFQLRAITIEPFSGDLCVADFNYGFMNWFTPGGVYKNRFNGSGSAGELSLPYGLGVDGDGNVDVGAVAAASGLSVLK